MSEQKESSVLFSLKELMSLEEDRIRTEEADKAASVAAAEKARVEAERAARDAEEARIRAEEERRRMDELRSREEAARHEAIRQAEIEKARVEAEQQARLQAMAAQQQHEQNLAALKHDEGKKKLRNALIIGGVAVVLIGGGATYLVVQNSARQQAELATIAAQKAQAEDEAKKRDAQLKEQAAKIDGLLNQLSSAKDDAQRLALQKQLEEEKAKTDSIRKGGGGPAKSDAPAAPKKKCHPGDPLCTDI
jgi:colicin import membrane protein